MTFRKLKATLQLYRILGGWYVLPSFFVDDVIVFSVCTLNWVAVFCSLFGKQQVFVSLHINEVIVGSYCCGRNNSTPFGFILKFFFSLGGILFP